MSSHDRTAELEARIRALNAELAAAQALAKQATSRIEMPFPRRGPSLLKRVAEIGASLAAEAAAHPWRSRLASVQGQIDPADGTERISSSELFDLLEVGPQNRRTGTFRKLSAVMRELGWTPVRVITRSGQRAERTRGYQRTREHA